MRIQIRAALRNAVAHGRDGLSDEDPPRVITGIILYRF
jgi:hypothetical protein